MRWWASSHGGQAGGSRIRTVLMVALIVAGSAICFQMFGAQLKDMVAAVANRIGNA